MRKNQQEFWFDYFTLSVCVCDDDDCWKQTDLLAQWIWLKIQFSLIVRIQFSNRFSVRHLIYKFVEVSVCCLHCLSFSVSSVLSSWSSSVLFDSAWICAVCIVCVVFSIQTLGVWIPYVLALYAPHIPNYLIYWIEWIAIRFNGVWCCCNFFLISLCTFCIKFDSLNIVYQEQGDSPKHCYRE